MNLVELGDAIYPWQMYDNDPLYLVARSFKELKDPEPSLVQQTRNTLKAWRGRVGKSVREHLDDTIAALESYMLCRGISLEKELL